MNAFSRAQVQSFAARPVFGLHGYQRTVQEVDLD